MWVSPYLYAQQGPASCSSDWAAPGASPVPVSEASHCTTQHVRQLPEHTRHLRSLVPSQRLCPKVCVRPSAGRSESIRELGTKSLQRPKPPSELGLLSKSSQRPGVCMHGVKKPNQACLCAWLATTLALTLKSSGSRHTQGRRQSRRRAHLKQRPSLAQAAVTGNMAALPECFNTTSYHNGPLASLAAAKPGQGQQTVYRQ